MKIRLHSVRGLKLEAVDSDNDGAAKFKRGNSISVRFNNRALRASDNNRYD